MLHEVAAVTKTRPRRSRARLVTMNIRADSALRGTAATRVRAPIDHVAGEIPENHVVPVVVPDVVVGSPVQLVVGVVPGPGVDRDLLIGTEPRAGNS
jgi:hypothetical protein